MGIPQKFKSDNRSPFQVAEFAEIYAEFGIEHQKITPLWSQANGQIENFNKNLKRFKFKVFLLKIINWETETESSFLRFYPDTRSLFLSCCVLLVPLIATSDSILSKLLKNEKQNNKCC
jgi:transposase InsO family protein